MASLVDELLSPLRWTVALRRPLPSLLTWHIDMGRRPPGIDVDTYCLLHLVSLDPLWSSRKRNGGGCMWPIGSQIDFRGLSAGLVHCNRHDFGIDVDAYCLLHLDVLAIH